MLETYIYPDFSRNKHHEQHGERVQVDVPCTLDMDIIQLYDPTLHGRVYNSLCLMSIVYIAIIFHKFEAVSACARKHVYKYRAVWQMYTSLLNNSLT